MNEACGNLHWWFLWVAFIGMVVGAFGGIIVLSSAIMSIDDK